MNQKDVKTSIVLFENKCYSAGHKVLKKNNQAETFRAFGEWLFTVESIYGQITIHLRKEKTRT